MKEDSKWPMGSYIAIIIGAAAVLILKLYAAQKGASHLSGGRLFPIALALSPFLFAILVLHLQNRPRPIKWVSVAIMLQSLGAVAGYCHALFGEFGLQGVIDFGMVPLYQFAILGIAAMIVQFLDDAPQTAHGSRKK